MLPDGCYIGLGFDEYIREPDCLGSTDKGRLWTRGAGWWWGSKHNPFHKPDTRSDEQLFGECAHVALLEGLHQYESRYIVEPSKRDHPDALFTVPQIKAALKDAGVYPPRSSDFTKEDWAEVAEAYLPDRPVWENVIGDFNRRLARGRRSIPAEADFAIRAMRDLAVGEHSTDELRELLSVGSEFPILAELSFFYTDETGQRHRARFDKILPTGIVDLKTVGNWRGREMVHGIDRHVKDNAYDVQLADYQLARRAMMTMIREDEACIHGGTEEERDHLVAMAHYDLTHAKPLFCWIFYEKPTAAGAPPVLFPVIDTWGGPYHRAGFRKRHAALETYRTCMEQFGPSKPWGRVEPVHYVDEAREPHITLSHFGFGPDEEVPGEREHFA